MNVALLVVGALVGGACVGLGIALVRLYRDDHRAVRFAAIALLLGGGVLVGTCFGNLL